MIQPKKRRKKQQRGPNMLHAYQQIIAALAVRLGGSVYLGSQELSAGKGDPVELSIGEEGVTIQVHRQIKIVNSLN